MNYVRLSKTVAKALRHTPWEYELELDEEGWTPVDDLLAGLRSERDFSEVTRADLEHIITSFPKTRYEMRGDKIRAFYGHSVPGKLTKTPATPPEILYHGTAARFVENIRKEGLKPMRRQYVHLSGDEETAGLVGSRKGSGVVILQIRAGEAAKQGITFYNGNEQVWLADAVPPAWIIFP